VLNNALLMQNDSIQLLREAAVGHKPTVKRICPESRKLSVDLWFLQRPIQAPL